MTIQDTIIEALKASQTAHSRALTTIAGLRADKTALEAERARLNAQVANLRSHIAHLEAESVKIVEPASVQSLLASLLQIVEETQHATLPPQNASIPVAAERRRDDDAPPSSVVTHPLLSLQQRHVDRDAAQEAMDAAQ